jgi:hypothetical protein
VPSGERGQLTAYAADSSQGAQQAVGRYRLHARPRPSGIGDSEEIRPLPLINSPLPLSSRRFGWTCWPPGRSPEPHFPA